MPVPEKPASQEKTPVKETAKPQAEEAVLKSEAEKAADLAEKAPDFPAVEEYKAEKTESAKMTNDDLQKIIENMQEPSEKQKLAEKADVYEINKPKELPKVPSPEQASPAEFSEGQKIPEPEDVTGLNKPIELPAAESSELTKANETAVQPLPPDLNQMEKISKSEMPKPIKPKLIIEKIEKPDDKTK